MVLGLDAGKVSMTGMYDVTSSNIGNHQTKDYLDSEEIYSIAQMPRKSASKGIAKIGLCIEKYSISIVLKLKLSFRTSIFRAA